MTAEPTPKPLLEPHSVEVSVHPPTVELGQPFALEVVLKHPEAFRFELAALPYSPSFDVLSKVRGRDDNAPDTTTFSLQMAAFELGTLELPRFQFEVTTPSQVGFFVLPGKTIVVATARDEAASQLEDVRPPAPVFVPHYVPLYVGAALVALVVAGLLLWRWLKRPRQRPDLLPLPTKPLAERTREALALLRAQELPAQGKMREYYFVLSEIIRAYVGELHRFDALECTTTEWVAALQRLPSTRLPIEALAQFSYASDFIKYAKGHADLAQCEKDLAFAYSLVDTTTPIDEVLAHHAQPPLP